MDLILIALCAAAAIIAVWLIWGAITWYFADNQKMLAPWAEGRITYLTVLVSSAENVWNLSGLAKLYSLTRKTTLALWAYWAPRLTDRTILAALFADLSVAAAGENVWLWMAQHPIVALIVLVINLLAAAPKSAPDRLALA